MTGAALLHQEAQATLQAEAQAVTAEADIAEEPAGVPEASAEAEQAEAVEVPVQEGKNYN